MARGDAHPMALLSLCARIAFKHAYCGEEACLLPESTAMTSAGLHYVHTRHATERHLDALSKELYYDYVFGGQALAGGTLPENGRDPRLSGLTSFFHCFWCDRIVMGGFSIDRAYDQLSYTDPLQKLLPSCSDCNHMRKSLPVEEFVKWSVDVVNNSDSYCQKIVDTQDSFVFTEHTSSLPDLAANVQHAVHPCCKDERNGAAAMRSLVSKAYELEFEGKRPSAKAISTEYKLSEKASTKLFEAAARPGCWDIIFFTCGDSTELYKRLQHGVPYCFRQREPGGGWNVQKYGVAFKNEECASEGVKRKRDDGIMETVEYFEGQNVVATFLSKTLNTNVALGSMGRWLKNVPERHRHKVYRVFKKDK